jgi:transcriptional regulator with GAF, ATPase, and Fis domain
LIRLSGKDLVAAIEDTPRQIGEKLDVSCSTLVEFSDKDDSIETAHHWPAPAGSAGDHDAVPVLQKLIERLAFDETGIVLERIPEDLPVEVQTADIIERMRLEPVRSVVIIPISIGGRRSAVWAIGALRRFTARSEMTIERLRLLAQLLGSALYRRRQEQTLSESRADTVRLTGQLDIESAPVEEVTPLQGFEEIIGNSPVLRMALAQLQEVAPTNSTVLLLGETGTGKELFARALHAHGPRRSFPLVSVNCAALPPTLIESELFGHERGAFTGAVSIRQGRFETAHRGTLFLDEIADLPPDLQAKLLRVLQEGAFERIGSSSTRKVDVRIVTATHRDLAHEVAEGRFRDDLYYRLSVFPIRLPPLRERREDIPALVSFIIHKRQREMHRQIKRVPQRVMDALQRHSWPGNIRELENVIERALIHSTGDTLVLLDKVLETPEIAAPDDATLTTVERAHIEEVLRECGWRINGAGNAAERLGLHPNTLRFRMKKLGIVRGTDAPPSRSPSTPSAPGAPGCGRREMRARN